MDVLSSSFEVNFLPDNMFVLPDELKTDWYVEQAFESCFAIKMGFKQKKSREILLGPKAKEVNSPKAWKALAENPQKYQESHIRIKTSEYPSNGFR